MNLFPGSACIKCHFEPVMEEGMGHHCEEEDGVITIWMTWPTNPYALRTKEKDWT